LVHFLWANKENERNYLKVIYYLLLLFAQKKEQEKGTLFHGPSGYLALLAFVGT